ncbi:hypothetical protein OROGR_016240 [Orobanche gracilis]
MTERVNMHIANFFYENGIPFNVAHSRSYEIMIESIGQFGPGLKPPTYHDLRVPLLEKAKKETDKLRERHEKAWKQYGCTLMCDGFSDWKGRHLINFLVNSPEGTFFLGTVDASSRVQDARMLATLLDEQIDLIGREHVIQVITDNGEKMVVETSVVEKISDQADLYENSRNAFEKQLTVRSRKTKNPLDWWGAFGGLTIELAMFAKRIVGLCCSSSGCERNWSTFEFSVDRALDASEGIEGRRNPRRGGDIVYNRRASGSSSHADASSDLEMEVAPIILDDDVGTLENLLQCVEQVDEERIKKALISNAEQAILSKNLAMLRSDLPFYMVPFTTNDLNFIKPEDNGEKFTSLLTAISAYAEGFSADSIIRRASYLWKKLGSK